MGFRFNGNDLYGFFHDGTALRVTPKILTTLHPFGAADVVQGSIVYTAGVGLVFTASTFWGASGSQSLAYSSTGNIPFYCTLALTNGIDATVEQLAAKRVGYDEAFL
jgi:hypothetical protein